MSSSKAQFLGREHFEAYGEIYPEIGRRDALRLFNTLVDGEGPSSNPQASTIMPFRGIEVIPREQAGLEPLETDDSYRLPNSKAIDIDAYAVNASDICQIATDVLLARRKNRSRLNVFETHLIALSIHLNTQEQ